MLNPLFVTGWDTIIAPDPPAGKAESISTGTVRVRSDALALHTNSPSLKSFGPWMPAVPTMTHHLGASARPLDSQRLLWIYNRLSVRPRERFRKLGRELKGSDIGAA